MSRELRVTPETNAVLHEFLSKPGERRYGREIGAELGLKPGTVGPILQRLEEKGLVGSEMEDPVVADQEKRPRRRYYHPLFDSKESMMRKLLDSVGEPKPSGADAEKVDPAIHAGRGRDMKIPTELDQRIFSDEGSKATVAKKRGDYEKVNRTKRVT